MTSLIAHLRNRRDAIRRAQAIERALADPTPAPSSVATHAPPVTPPKALR